MCLNQPDGHVEPWVSSRHGVFTRCYEMLIRTAQGSFWCDVRWTFQYYTRRHVDLMHICHDLEVTASLRWKLWRLIPGNIPYESMGKKRQKSRYTRPWGLLPYLHLQVGSKACELEQKSSPSWLLGIGTNRLDGTLALWGTGCASERIWFYDVKQCKVPRDIRFKEWSGFHHITPKFGYWVSQ